MHIFIHRNDEQLGPFTEAEVRAHIASGQLSAVDHVWWDGQGDWVPLSESSLFAPLFAPATEHAGHPSSIEETAQMPRIEPEPAPVPEPDPEPAPEPKPATQTQKRRRSSSSHAKAKSNTGLVIGGIVAAVVILGGVAYYFIGTDSQDFSNLTNPTSQPYQTAPPATAPDQATPAATPAPDQSMPSTSPAPAPDATSSPMPTPMMRAPQLSLPPQAPATPSSDPTTNAAPPLSPGTPANQ